jgi:hypothetical protein
MKWSYTLLILIGLVFSFVGSSNPLEKRWEEGRRKEGEISRILEGFHSLRETLDREIERIPALGERLSARDRKAAQRALQIGHWLKDQSRHLLNYLRLFYRYQDSFSAEIYIFEANEFLAQQSVFTDSLRADRSQVGDPLGLILDEIFETLRRQKGYLFLVKSKARSYLSRKP